MNLIPRCNDITGIFPNTKYSPVKLLCYSVLFSMKFICITKCIDVALSIIDVCGGSVYLTS